MIINTKKGKAPNIEALSVTANGTYTAPEGVDGYSPVSVNVPTSMPSNWIEFSVDRTKKQENEASSVGARGVLILHGDVVPTGFGNTYDTFSFASAYAVTGFTFADTIRYIGCGAFRYSKYMVNANFPECVDCGDSAFYAGGATRFLQTVYLPKVRKLKRHMFANQTNMTTCQIGSVGYSVDYSGEMGAYRRTFEGCTQSGLTITLYTNAANIDDVLNGTRSKATNATIIIKASENLTYGGVSYSAGDTVITDSPSA